MASLIDRLRPQVSRQLAGDVSWNAASFVVMGVAGFALNLIIAGAYDSAILGAFNQVYTVYILLSQVAVAGLHLSVLRHAAAHRGHADDILAGALAATVLVAVPVAAAGYLGSNLVGLLVDSELVARGIRLASIGVACFALNKVLLALHNGLALMRAFAVFQGLRFALMVAFLAGMAVLRRPGADLPLIFTLAEAVLLVALAAYTVRRHTVRLTRRARVWIRRHFRFGRRAMWGNLLADINTRVDILILGVFTADATVGIYSFAALIAEGFSQLAIVFRNVVNPRLARYHAERTTGELEEKLRHGMTLTYRVTVPLGAALVLAFPLIVTLLRVGSEYLAAWPVFAVLMVGITASMGYSAFQMLLNQGGFPGYQSAFFALTFATNVVLNVLLIPVWGMMGSAVATGLTFVMSIWYIRALVWKAMRIRM